MQKIRTLIIEDEEPARKLISSFLSMNDKVELIGEFPDGFSGIKAIQELKPDLIFLDVQMPKITGFEMLELIQDHPLVIFTTAYDQFALKAFEINAVDYLLKPYSKSRFNEALGKAIKRFEENKNDREEVKKLIDYSADQTEILDRIAVRNGSKITLINLENILYLAADDDYVSIHSDEGNYLKEQTLKYYEQHLPPNDFIRIHRSYIVRTDRIQKIEPYAKESHVIILKNGEKIKVSKSGYKNLREKLKF